MKPRDDWRAVRLDEIAEVRLGRQRSPERADGPNMRPYMRAANVGWDGLRLDDVKEMDFDPKEFVTYELKRGDILVGEASGSRNEVGKSAVWRDEIPGVCFQNTLIRIRANKDDPDYIQQHLKHDALRGALAEAARGVGIHHLGRECLASWQIALPPLDEQRRIVAKIEALTQRSRRAKEALDAIPPLLERFRQSVLAAAFRGDLTKDWRKQHPDVEPADKLLQRIRTERRKRWEEAELAKLKAKGKAPKDDRWKEKYEEPEAVDAEGLPELPEGWCWASVEQLAFVESGQTPDGLADFDALARSGTPWFRISDMNAIENAELMRVAAVRLSPDEVQRFGLHVRPAGTIVFPKRGGAIATNKKRRLAQASAYDLNTMGLVPVPSASDYLWAWFQSVDLGRLNTGSTVPQINHGDIAPLRIPLPPRQEVERICGGVVGAMKMARTILGAQQFARASAEQLDAAILAKAFRGELTQER